MASERDTFLVFIEDDKGRPFVLFETAMVDPVEIKEMTHFDRDDLVVRTRHQARKDPKLRRAAAAWDAGDHRICREQEARNAIRHNEWEWRRALGA